MEEILERLWIRVVVFNQKNQVLISRNNNVYEFPKARKLVPYGASLKNQTRDIMEKGFGVSGAERGGVIYLGVCHCSEGIEIFIKVKLLGRQVIKLNHNYLWVDKSTNFGGLKLNPVTQKILENIFKNRNKQWRKL